MQLFSFHRIQIFFSVCVMAVFLAACGNDAEEVRFRVEPVFIANPTGFAPLTAKIDFTADRLVSAFVQVSDGDETYFINPENGFRDVKQSLFLLGFKPDKNYTLTMFLRDEDNALADREFVFDFQTPALPDTEMSLEADGLVSAFPSINRIDPTNIRPLTALNSDIDSSLLEQNVIANVAVSTRVLKGVDQEDTSKGLIYAFDLDGDVIWYLDLPFIVHEVSITNARRILVTNYHGDVVEMNMLGEVVRYFDASAVPEYVTPFEKAVNRGDIDMSSAVVVSLPQIAFFTGDLELRGNEILAVTLNADAQAATTSIQVPFPGDSSQEFPLQDAANSNDTSNIAETDQDIIAPYLTRLRVDVNNESERIRYSYPLTDILATDHFSWGADFVFPRTREFFSTLSNDAFVPRDLFQTSGFSVFTNNLEQGFQDVWTISFKSQDAIMAVGVPIDPNNVNVPELSPALQWILGDKEGWNLSDRGAEDKINDDLFLIPAEFVTDNDTLRFDPLADPSTVEYPYQTALINAVSTSSLGLQTGQLLTVYDTGSRRAKWPATAVAAEDYAARGYITQIQALSDGDDEGTESDGLGFASLASIDGSEIVGGYYPQNNETTFYSPIYGAYIPSGVADTDGSVFGVLTQGWATILDGYRVRDNVTGNRMDVNFSNPVDALITVIREVQVASADDPDTTTPEVRKMLQYNIGSTDKNAAQMWGWSVTQIQNVRSIYSANNRISAIVSNTDDTSTDTSDSATTNTATNNSTN